MHHVLILFMHHINCYFLYCFCSNCVWCSLPLGFSCFLSFVSCLSILLLFSIMVRKTRAHKTSTSSSPSSTGDLTANAFVGWFQHSSNVDTILTVQVTHGQLLVDVLTELQALREELASFRRSPPPPPFDDESWLPFGNSSQKGGVHMVGVRGRYFFCLRVLEL